MPFLLRRRPMNQIVRESGWRGSQEAWLEAAHQAFLASGVDGVKVLPLANKLGLSRTSFYWFFKDRDALLDALVAKWRENNTGNIIKQSEAYAESIAEAMLNVFDCWLDKNLFDPQFEFAVRSWSLQSNEILAEVRKADSLRLDALRRMMMRFGHREHIADVRARTTYLVQIGYISAQSKEDLALRMSRIHDYVEIFTGQAPEPRELERFFARHGYSPNRKARRR